MWLQGERMTMFDLHAKQRLLREVSDRVGVPCISVVVDVHHTTRDEFVTIAQLVLFRRLFRKSLGDGNVISDNQRKPPRGELHRIRSLVRQLQEQLGGLLAAQSL